MNFHEFTKKLSAELYKKTKKQQFCLLICNKKTVKGYGKIFCYSYSRFIAAAHIFVFLQLYVTFM